MEPFEVLDFLDVPLELGSAGDDALRFPFGVAFLGGILGVVDVAKLIIDILDTDF